MVLKPITAGGGTASMNDDPVITLNFWFVMAAMAGPCSNLLSCAFKRFKQ